MGIFAKLLGSKLTRKQVESLLDEIERLSKLRYLFPAVVRLKMLTEKAPRDLVGTEGLLHDRFCVLGLELCRSIGSRPEEMVQITHAWDALPNVLHTSVDFRGGSLSPSSDHVLHALADRAKEFVVMSNANSNVRERNPERQMRVFFDLVDHPHWSLVLLIFSGSLVVRSSVIREHPSALSPVRLEELFPRLCSAAQNDGAIKIYR